jgi:hypothetical protein
LRLWPFLARLPSLLGQLSPQPVDVPPRVPARCREVRHERALLNPPLQGPLVHTDSACSVIGRDEVRTCHVVTFPQEGALIYSAVAFQRD